MWPQNYTPVGGSLGMSALVAAVPIFVLLFLLGVLRKPAWMSSLFGLGAAAAVGLGVYGMHAGTLASAIGMTIRLTAGIAARFAISVSGATRWK